jgi:D-glutamate cyclase
VKEVPLENIGEAVDRLITVPMSNWAILKGIPVAKLYEACRLKAGEPLTLAAARKLVECVRPGDTVIIATGFMILTCGKPETDGLIGAASLGRSISIGLKGIPVFVSEEEARSALTATVAASGLLPWDAESVRQGSHRAAIEGYPVDDAQARIEAARMLDRYRPSALIAVERPGWNRRHVHHSGGGFGISEFTAKIDYLFDEAKARGILTVGIGDLGNELGMGYIEGVLRTSVPHGAVCQCPCGGGISAAFEPDLGIFSNISNWGAYGIEACLSAILGEPEVLHDGATERRMIEEAVRGGAIDAVAGMFRPYVDGTSADTNATVVELLRNIVSYRVPGDLFTREYIRSWEPPK